MKRLTGASELLDGALDDPLTLAGNLRDLRRINRLLGGVTLSRLGLERLAGPTADGGGTVTMIDVGTGGADIPAALLSDWSRRGRRLQVTAVDQRAEVLAAARLARPALDRLRGLTLQVADGLALPYRTGAFDVAHASLVLHHFEPRDAVALLRELGRVSRRGVVVNDLARGRLNWLGAWLVSHVVSGNRYTRHDAPLSVRRAYTLHEAHGLLAAAGLRTVAQALGPGGHRWALVAVAE